jgi:hypothetical protein
LSSPRKREIRFTPKKRLSSPRKRGPSAATAEGSARWCRCATLQPARFWVPACAGMTSLFFDRKFASFIRERSFAGMTSFVCQEAPSP